MSGGEKLAQQWASYFFAFAGACGLAGLGAALACSFFTSLAGSFALGCSLAVDLLVSLASVFGGSAFCGFSVFSVEDSFADSFSELLFIFSSSFGRSFCMLTFARTSRL